MLKLNTQFPFKESQKALPRTDLVSESTLHHPSGGVGGGDGGVGSSNYEGGRQNILLCGAIFQYTLYKLSELLHAFPSSSHKREAKETTLSGEARALLAHAGIIYEIFHVGKKRPDPAI